MLVRINLTILLQVLLWEEIECNSLSKYNFVYNINCIDQMCEMSRGVIRCIFFLLPINEYFTFIISMHDILIAFNK